MINTSHTTRAQAHNPAFLLRSLDSQAGLIERHLWLVRALAWIRGDSTSAEAAAARVGQLLDAVDASPGMAARLQQWWNATLEIVDGTTLLADFGFASRSAFVSELAERLRLKILPGTPETIDAAELFSLVLGHNFDAQWISTLDDSLLSRLAQLLSPATPTAAGPTLWQHTLLEAITFCTSQIRASGFAPELRLRMSPAALQAQAFHALAADFDALRTAYLVQRASVEASVRNTEPGCRGADGDLPLQAALQQFRERLDQCRQAASTVYSHLEEHGISVNLVFRLRQLRERVLRIRALLDCLLGANPAASTARLFAHLVTVGQERRSLRALVASNSSLLAAKVAERSSETGEHYITRTPLEYRAMLRAAAGGGALTAVTTTLKFMVMTLGLSQFWNGFWSGFVYAASFIAIQLLHCTLATKQPAMTAPAMAAKLKDLADPQALAGFVDEVTHLVRSQVAAVLGNVGLVVPAVVLISVATQLALGSPLIDSGEAAHVFAALSLAGPTVVFAAFTGVLLFASSIVGGWVENWFALHRLHSALRYNPRVTQMLGAGRAAQWAHFMRDKISGFASNIALGFMLGLIPAFAAFFGLGLEVRHVTLSAGQLAAAGASVGWAVLQQPALWWSLAAVPVIGAANLGVSFYLAFRLALRAHNVAGVDRTRISRAILKRWRRQPLSFFWPPPDGAANANEADNRKGEAEGSTKGSSEKNG